MSGALVCILAFVFMVVIIFLGCPVVIAMFVSAIFGMLAITSPEMMMQQLTNIPFTTAASYTYAILPLFGLMGVLSEISGIAEGTFNASEKWLGNARGGLLSTVVVANTIFGACSAVPTAGCIVFAKMAWPSLRKAGYEKGNALACITCASTQASLIPPSATLMLCCMITGLSINRGLMCGFGSGLLMMILFLVAIRITALLPGKIPPVEKTHVPLKEKLLALRFLLPVVALFCLIIIGSYAGFFTTTVGGAVGTFAICVYCLFKRIPLKRVAKAALEAVVINANVFPMLLAGSVFGRFVTMSKLPDLCIRAITGANIPPMLVFTLILAFYLVAGCLMDVISSILITVPIVFPVLTQLGFDPYALVIVLVLVANMGAITPPIGMGVFITANTIHEEPMTIFRGVVPYFIIMVIASYLIVLFPQIATLLPDLLAAGG